MTDYQHPRPMIFTQLAAVMKDVGAVRKSERNEHQKFNFRGIDAVINAASPALRKHGVIVIPSVIESTYDNVQVGQNRTNMGHARLTVAYRFCAEDGSEVVATVAAESMDSGDKATAKAMSVAFRTALLQTLCLPTDDTDPDAETFVRSEPSRRSAPSQQQSAPENSGRIASESQRKYVNDLIKKLEITEQLLIDQWQTTVDAMTSSQAKQIIDTLNALKRGEVEIGLRDDGSFTII